MYYVRADFAISQRDAHCTSVSLILQPSHLVSDGSLVVKADPLVVMYEVRHFHLVIPDVGGSIQQHLADLEPAVFKTFIYLFSFPLLIFTSSLRFSRKPCSMSFSF